MVITSSPKEGLLGVAERKAEDDEARRGGIVWSLSISSCISMNRPCKAFLAIAMREGTSSIPITANNSPLCGAGE